MTRQEFSQVKDRPEVAKRIRAARSQIGLSQDELGENLGLSSGAQISHWEKNGRVSRENLEKLAAALNVSVDWLLTGRTSGPGKSQPASQSPLVGRALANHVRSNVIKYRLRRTQGASPDELRNLRSIIRDGVHQIVTGGFDDDTISDVMTEEWLKDADEGGIADIGDHGARA